MYGIDNKFGSLMQTDLISIGRAEQQDKHKMRLMERREAESRLNPDGKRAISNKKINQRALVLRLAGIVLKF